eukprot:gene12267-14203_t
MNIELTLTPALKEQTVNELRVAFADVPSALFNELTPILHQAMDFVAIKFNFKSSNIRLKMFADQYLPENFATDAAGKARLETIRLIVAACCVLLLSKHDHAKSLFITPFHAEAYLDHYLEINNDLFASTTEIEEARFVPFINILRTTLLVVPPRLNKQLIINIACRLQTPHPLIYTWGKGMCPELKRFVAIYEKESGETLKARPERAQKRSASDSSTSSDADDVSYGSHHTEDDQLWQCRRTDVRVAGVPLNSSAEFFFNKLQEPQEIQPVRTEASQAQLEVSYSDQLLNQFLPAGAALVDFNVSFHDTGGQVQSDLPICFSESLFGYRTEYVESLSVSS